MHEHTTSPDSNVQSGRSASTERSRVRRGNVDVRRAAGGGGDSGTSSIWAARCAEPPASRSLFHKDIVWMFVKMNINIFGHDEKFCVKIYLLKNFC